MKHKIGIAIPCFNNLDVLKTTIPPIYNKEYCIVVFDDNSTDGTKKWLNENYPKINYLSGNGHNWWGGSLAKAINFCLKNKCDFILSLNADVIIDQNTIQKLVNSSINNSSPIVASVVVDNLEQSKIAWAGSRFKKIHKFLPIYVSKYIKKYGNKFNEIGEEIYDVDEVHGRGVIISKEVFKIIGNYDANNFPHYGADTDFSFRAKRAGIRLIVDPKCVSKVFINNTGLPHYNNQSIIQRTKSIYNYLTKTKYGDALNVQWKIYSKYVPFFSVIPSYIFVILLNIFRKVTK
jgi:GT2 family glycosyltransferase